MERDSASGMRSLRGTAEEPGGVFLGRYRVVDEIGRGGMASVHLARVDGPGGFQKWVAIKRIHPHLVENDQLVDMFLDEARMAAGISHPNVAQVFDIGKDDKTYWIAMEYLHGEPVRELQRAGEEKKAAVLPPELVARIIADAAEGLHAAHELRGKTGELLGLVHRDVSPHNLFVTYDGYTKVVDFGIAKATGRLASTHAGELKGKMAYMAPEQLRSQDLDRRTDVFALGVVLWELTTNRRLFRRDSDLETLERVQACEVPRPSELVPGYPPELEQIALKALARDKAHRFDTARAFSRALEQFLHRRALVGFEEIAEVMRGTFADRLAKRNKHLDWAAESTSTSTPEPRPALPSEDVATLDAETSSRPSLGGGAPRPAAGDAYVKSVAEAAEKYGMLEDDEEAATLVAKSSRDYLAKFGITPAPAPRQRSDATQLLPQTPDDLQRTRAIVPGAPRAPHGITPGAGAWTPPSSRGPASTQPIQASPFSRGPSAAPPAATQAISSFVPPTQAMHAHAPPSVRDLPIGASGLPRVFEADTTTEAGRASGVPPSSGFRAPHDADPSITMPRPFAQGAPRGPVATMPDQQELQQFAAPQPGYGSPLSSASPLEVQLAAAAQARRARLTLIIAVLAAACAIALSFLVVTLLRSR